MRYLDVVTAGLIGAVLLIAPAFAQEPPAIGRLVQLTGGVVVLRSGEPEPASLEAPVLTGDTLRTYGDGKVLLVLDGGVRLTLGPDSEVQLTELTPPARTGRLDALFRLLDGIVRVLIAEGGPGGAVDVQASAATASARSTEFVVLSEPERTSVLAVAREVVVTGRGGAAVTLQPGEGTDVAEVPGVQQRVRVEGFPATRELPDGPPTVPTPPKRWGEPRRADAIARTSF